MEKTIERKYSKKSLRIATALSFGAAACFSLAAPSAAQAEREECSDIIGSIAPYQYEEVIDDISSVEVMSTEDLAQHLAEIEEVYGIPIVVQEVPTSENAVRIAATLAGVVDGLEEASPALTKVLDLERITVVEVLDSNDASIVGTYYSNVPEIAIRHNSVQGAAITTAHELIGHAADFQLLCPPNDAVHDEAIAQHGVMSEELIDTTDPNRGIKLEYYTATEDRLFAREYSAKNIGEDRATQIEWLFYRRGIIEERDPDFSSPFAAKQAEILRRLEMLLPGIEEHLEEKTKYLRITSDEILKSIPNPYKPGEVGSAGSILSHAYNNEYPVEQLRGTTVTISLPEHEVVTIQDPIIIRDTDGTITAYAWTPIGEYPYGIETLPNFSEYIHISHQKGAYSHMGLLVATSPGGKGFFEGGLQIGEVWAQEVLSNVK